MATLTTRLPFDDARLAVRPGDSATVSSDEILIEKQTDQGTSFSRYVGSFEFDPDFGTVNAGTLTDLFFRDFERGFDLSIEGGNVDAETWFSLLDQQRAQAAYDLWFVDGGTFIGSPGDDVLRGGPSDDVFTPGGGDDRVDGAGGENRVILSGQRSDFTVRALDDDPGVIVEDLRSGPESEGVNQLRNIQFIEFADELVDIRDLLTVAIDGDTLGAVVERDPEQREATGTLTITGPDPAELSFRPPEAEGLQGDFGQFVFDTATGEWTYILDNDAPAVRALDLGEQVSDSLTVTSLDGSASETITITVTGSGIPATPAFVVGGSVVDRAGNAMPDIVLTFTPEAGDAIAVESDEDGGFGFTLSPGAAGQIEAERPVSPDDPSITTSSALEALRLAVGLPPSWGPAEAEDYIAADFNGNGQVTAEDALDILRVSVGLTADDAPRWVFVDSEADLSEISRTNTQVEPGIALDPLTAATSDLSLTGILVGHVQEFA